MRSHRLLSCTVSPKHVPKVNWPNAAATRVHLQARQLRYVHVFSWNRRSVPHPPCRSRSSRHHRRPCSPFPRRAPPRRRPMVSSGVAVRMIWNSVAMLVNHLLMNKKHRSLDDALFEWWIYITTKLEDKYGWHCLVEWNTSFVVFFAMRSRPSNEMFNWHVNVMVWVVHVHYVFVGEHCPISVWLAPNCVRNTLALVKCAWIVGWVFFDPARTPWSYSIRPIWFISIIRRRFVRKISVWAHWVLKDENVI